MTYKNVSDDNSILGTKEVNVIVNDYNDAILFLQGCGLQIKAKQETKREIWTYGKVEICIDTWPWLPTFMEIEGPSEKSVWDTAEKLGFTKAEAKFGSVDTTYQPSYERIRRKNSSRVSGRVKAPMKSDVVVSECCFCTPLICMQRCSASMTTITPNGLRVR